VGRCCTAYDQYVVACLSVIWLIFSQKFSRQRDDTRSSLYMQQKHYLGVTEPHLLRCHLSFVSVSHGPTQCTHATRIYYSSLQLVLDNLVLFTWPTLTNEFGLLTGWQLRTLFPARWDVVAACLWSHTPVSLVVSESVWSKKELCNRALHEAIVLYMHTPIFTQNWPIISRNCTYFGHNHGRDTESQQLPKITAQGENHSYHGDREFMIYIHP